MALTEESSLPALPSSSLLSFLGIKEKDLPYRGKPELIAAVSQPVSFRLKDYDNDEGPYLWSCLTGSTFIGHSVPNAQFEKFRWKYQRFLERTDKGISEQESDNSTCWFLHEDGCQKESPIFTDSPVKAQARKFEKALDTADLRFWMYTVLPYGKGDQEEISYPDRDGEEVEQTPIEEVSEKVVLTSLEDKGQLSSHTKRDEYRARVKESLGFVQMRMEMLQELSLGEASKDESLTFAGVGDTSFMSGSSVLLRRSRKMAGLLHTDEQALSLQDLYQWFQNIGKVSACRKEDTSVALKEIC